VPSVGLMRRCSVLAVASAGSLLFCGIASASTHTEVAELGPISATFSYDGGSNESGFARQADLNLTITRGGTVVYQAPITSEQCPEGCEGAYETPDVHIVSLEGSGEPDVVLELWSGGASCCYLDQIFSYKAGSPYTIFKHVFGRTRPTLIQLGPSGTIGLTGSDERFEGAFTDDGASGRPLQLWTFADGHLTDVTRHYPSLISKAAVKQWGSFRHAPRDDDVGFMAGWAADELMLGRRSLVRTTLARELHAGRLRGPPIVGVSGSRFVHNLKTKLREWGYT
jgi:hypothetical protein